MAEVDLRRRTGQWSAAYWCGSAAGGHTPRRSYPVLRRDVADAPLSRVRGVSGGGQK
ncbi:Uncharacterised protein [Bordetella avium]|nr:Uncharacterised protein [Bordetella avium]